MNIFFDLDGTLTDPGLGITRSIQHALVRLGRSVPDADVFRRFIGPPHELGIIGLRGGRHAFGVQHGAGTVRFRNVRIRPALDE